MESPKMDVDRKNDENEHCLYGSDGNSGDNIETDDCDYDGDTWHYITDETIANLPCAQDETILFAILPVLSKNIATATTAATDEQERKDLK